MSAGTVGSCTTGIENYGTVNFTGGTLSGGTYGVQNSGNYNMNGGQITSYLTGVRNLANFNISGGSISNNSVYGIVNEASNTITGQVYMTGGNITSNSKYDIYHGKSDTDGAGAVYGGLRIERNDTVNSSILLAGYNNYIYTGNNTPQINSITLADAHLERSIIRSADTNNAETMQNRINVRNKGSFYCKANATNHSNHVVLWTNYTVTTQYQTKDGKTLDVTTKTYEYKQDYTTEAKTIEGYILSETPSNANGTTNGDITVIYYYEDDSNVAVVNYKDLLSGIISAKYWYNENGENFSGNGMNFEDGKIFEEYGFYKIVVTNSVGLTKTVTFSLNKESI